MNYQELLAIYQDSLEERQDFESEWKSIAEYLLPGHGQFLPGVRTTRRQLSSTKVINSCAEDYLQILISGLQNGLTSASRPWFDLQWSDHRLNKLPHVKQWLQDCKQILYENFARSKFYSVVHSLYKEHAGLGMLSMYVGDDADPYRFEPMTIGQYTIIYGTTGSPKYYFRIINRSPEQVVTEFGDRASEYLRSIVKEKARGSNAPTVEILEAITTEKFMDKPFTQYRFEMPSPATRAHGYGPGDYSPRPLSKEGFYEFPYPTARWSIIANDTYSLGIGSRALRTIKRLQEMEKTMLMASHKAADPPVNAPAIMKGKLNTLPGAKNYYTNPNAIITEIYNKQFNLQPLGAAIERVEQSLAKMFCVDVFLTGSRDPNATPYKAAEITARAQEQMLRLGPMVEIVVPEFFQPVIERCFNISMRRGEFAEPPSEIVELGAEYKIVMVSPLAIAQRSMELQSINSFLAFVGQAAQFDQGVLDNVDADAAVQEYADITGVKRTLVRTPTAVKQRRDERQKAIAAEQQRQMQLEHAQVSGTTGLQAAQTRKTEAEASATLLESQQTAQDIGML